jgi:hypothetical protein
MVGDEKMSKSLGNFTSLTDLPSPTDSRAYRLLVLRSHYRSPIEVTPGHDRRRRAGPGPTRRPGATLRPARARGVTPRSEPGLHWPPAARELLDEVVGGARRGPRHAPRGRPALRGRSAAANAPPTPGTRRWPGTWPWRSTPSSGPSGLALQGRRRQRRRASQALVSGATRPETPGTGPKPTVCATNWWPWAGRSRTPAAGTLIRRPKTFGGGASTK